MPRLSPGGGDLAVMRGGAKTPLPQSIFSGGRRRRRASGGITLRTLDGVRAIEVRACPAVGGAIGGVSGEEKVVTSTGGVL